jgi:hypothetical protein
LSNCQSSFGAQFGICVVKLNCLTKNSVGYIVKLVDFFMEKLTLTSIITVLKGPYTEKPPKNSIVDNFTTTWHINLFKNWDKQ